MFGPAYRIAGNEIAGNVSVLNHFANIEKACDRNLPGEM